MTIGEEIIFNAVRSALLEQEEFSGIPVLQPFDYGLSVDRETPDLWAVVQVSVASLIGDEFAEFDVNIFCCSKFDFDQTKEEVKTLRDAAVRIAGDRIALDVDGAEIQQISSAELSGTENIITISTKIFNIWR